jgi:glycosyltransferase involved in cell wall biosynthesis
MKIVLVGTRFLPYPHAGDKTFWFAALTAMARAGDEIRVVSVDAHGLPRSAVMPHLEWEAVGAVPFPLRTGPHRARYNPGGQEIGSITNSVSKALTMPRLDRALRKVVRSWNPDVVHFMDNLGPMTLPFVARSKVPTFVSAVTYDPRHLLYGWGLRMSLEGFRGVAVSSDAFRRQLERLGLAPSRLRTVRWGVEPGGAPSASERAAKKEELGIAPDSPLVLWSGFLQQTTVADFWVAFEAAERFARLDPASTVLFCFKPQHFRPEYARRSTPRLRVVSDPESFLRARDCADLFLNPVTRRGSILAPPLTWVEMMMKGVPILTTPCGALDETLGPGLAGRAAPVEQLPDLLAETLSVPAQREALRNRAREWAVRQFSLSGSVESLHRLWANP